MISIISPAQSVAKHLLSLFATEEFISSAYMATVNSGPEVEPLKLAGSRWVVVDRRSVVGSGCEHLSPRSGKRVLVRRAETIREKTRGSNAEDGEHDEFPQTPPGFEEHKPAVGPLFEARYFHARNRNAGIRARVFLDKVKRG